MATEITTWAELAAISSDLTGDYVLMNDLDSSSTGYDTYASSSANSGAGWSPLGNSSTKFTGTFDGDGHTISDLYINRSSTNYIGLFGYVYGGDISDIGVVDCDITGNAEVGGLVGRTYSSSSVTNSYSTGSVTGTTLVGGLVGYSYSSSVTNSYSTGSVTGTSYVGGLVGDNYSSSVTNSYSTGSVTGTTLVGGLVGYSYSSSITNCFWDMTTSGQSTSDGGTGKTTSQMYDYDTFNDVSWGIIVVSSFDPLTPTTWYINDGYDYPKLGWAYVGYEQLEGNVTFNSTAVSGATIYVIDTDSNKVINKGTTDASGDYSIGVEVGTYHVCCEYTSGGTKYNAESYPYVDVS